MEGRLVEVTFYGKEDCPLCDEAMALLERVRRARPFEMRVIDILRDRDAFDRYAELIPVVRIGEAEFHFKLDEDDVIAALSAAEET